MEQTKKTTSFVKQAAILAAAGLIARFIGFLYRLPLTGLIGDEGNAIYSAGYYVYTFFFILSSAGLPAAIAKMVSERTALKQYRNAHRVFELSLKSAAVVGLLCSLALWFGARQFAGFVKVEESWLVLRILSPTIFIVSVVSVYRGYFQGMGNSVPTAVSQLVEQIMNAIFTVLGAWLMLKVFSDIMYGAAGGTIGTGVGAAFGLVVMVLVYRMAKKGIMSRIASEKGVKIREGDRQILIELAKTAFPIIAGTAVFSFTNLIDARMVIDRLTNGAGFLYETAKVLYGQLSGKYVVLTTLPVSISTALATAAIPNIAASVALDDKRAVVKKINTSLRLAMIISIPAAVGIGVLSNQIIMLLFSTYKEGGELIKIGAASIIFLALAQITTGMLQAIGRVEIPACAAVIGALVKIPLNYLLIGIAGININGAVISTIACYVVAAVIDLTALKRITGIKLDFTGFLIKPAISSLLMGMVCYVSYYVLYYVLPKNAVCTIISIALGIISYFAVLIFLKGLNRADLSLMPMGDKMIRALEARRLL